MATLSSGGAGVADYGRGLVTCSDWLYKLRRKRTKNRKVRDVADAPLEGQDIPVIDGVLERHGSTFFEALLSWQRRFVTIEGPYVCYYSRVPAPAA